MSGLLSFLCPAPKQPATVTRTVHPDQPYLDAWGLTPGAWASLSSQERAYRRWNVAKALHHNEHNNTLEGPRP